MFLYNPVFFYNDGKSKILRENRAANYIFLVCKPQNRKHTSQSAFGQSAFTFFSLRFL